jgi:hypothetical protein
MATLTPGETGGQGQLHRLRTPLLPEGLRTPPTHQDDRISDIAPTEINGRGKRSCQEHRVVAIPWLGGRRQLSSHPGTRTARFPAQRPSFSRLPPHLPGPVGPTNSQDVERNKEHHRSEESGQCQASNEQGRRLWKLAEWVGYGHPQKVGACAEFPRGKMVDRRRARHGIDSQEGQYGSQKSPPNGPDDSFRLPLEEAATNDESGGEEETERNADRKGGNVQSPAPGEKETAGVGRSNAPRKAYPDEAHDDDGDNPSSRSPWRTCSTDLARPARG